MPDPFPSHDPPPPPRPRFFEARFWTGFGAGFLACIFLGVVGSLVLVAVLVRAPRGISGAGEAGLGPPALPSLPLPAGTSAVSETDRLNLVDLDGVAFDASSLKGKVVFLNVWATWCGPCRAEMPSIERLRSKLKEGASDGGPVAFVVVSEEPLKVVAPFVKRSGWTFPVYRTEGVLPRSFWSRAIPATFILTPEGRVAFTHTGAARWDDDSVVAFLKGLAAPAASASP